MTENSGRSVVGHNSLQKSRQSKSTIKWYSLIIPAEYKPEISIVCNCYGWPERLSHPKGGDLLIYPYGSTSYIHVCVQVSCKP